MGETREGEALPDPVDMMWSCWCEAFNAGVLAGHDLSSHKERDTLFQWDQSYARDAAHAAAAAHRLPDAASIAKAFWFALHERDVQSEHGWRSNAPKWIDAMMSALPVARSSAPTPQEGTPHET